MVATETPQGLTSFPVTKMCALLSVGIPIFASVAGVKHWFLLYIDPFISEYKQYYRFLTFQVAAVNETDVILLTLIWYYFRHLERLFGSRKYISLITLSWAYTSVAIIVAAWVFNLIPFFKWNRFTSGAIPIVMSLFHFYKEHTPQMYQFDVKLIKPLGARSKQLKWTFNDQFVINALVAILLLNQGLVSIATGFLSWMCGVFIERGLFPGFDMFRVPFFKQSSQSASTGIMASESHSSTPDLDGAAVTPGPNNGDDEHGDEPGDEPARPLGVQFLNTFRM
ncbi:LAME_0G19306g1_1 [Lachancea meyersii CBS 8951]|uniref:LAME_0G19306g1_1 n=1 Tax=Lachancea meyersii CBS 8951 TaxID=1266667 RepID=A0A1G4KC58_9SACH|nr:LAME_0G19306g1_1 [Lachancea meyersii CBS 8951]